MPALQVKSDPLKILVISLCADDKAFLKTSLKEEAYQCVFIDSTQQALQLIQNSPPTAFNAFLLSNSEDNTSLSLLKILKNHPVYAAVPIIFKTHEHNAHQTQTALEYGDCFYLLTPYNKTRLLSVLEAAMKGFTNNQNIHRRISDIEAIRPLLQSAEFQLRTVQEAKSLSSVIAYTVPNFNEVAIGLFELMLNAIEHGNLDISYLEKTQLIQENRLQDEIQKRLQRPEFLNRFVKVNVERTAEALYVTIQDCGKGFDFKPYLNFCPERAMNNHGRGIMIANNLSFDTLTYQNNGNTVVVSVNLPKPS